MCACVCGLLFQIYNLGRAATKLTTSAATLITAEAKLTTSAAKVTTAVTKLTTAVKLTRAAAKLTITVAKLTTNILQQWPRFNPRQCQSVDFKGCNSAAASIFRSLENKKFSMCRMPSLVLLSALQHSSFMGLSSAGSRNVLIRPFCHGSGVDPAWKGLHKLIFRIFWEMLELRKQPERERAAPPHYVVDMITWMTSTLYIVDLNTGTPSPFYVMDLNTRIHNTHYVMDLNTWTLSQSEMVGGNYFAPHRDFLYRQTRQTEIFFL